MSIVNVGPLVAMLQGVRREVCPNTSPAANDTLVARGQLNSATNEDGIIMSKARGQAHRVEEVSRVWLLQSGCAVAATSYHPSNIMGLERVSIW
jgi:hypothetical protein